MKKLLFVAAVASAFGLFAADDEGVQDGTQVLEVGITAITSPLKNTVIAISYENLVNGDKVMAEHLVKTTNLQLGDQLFAFKDGVYHSWTLEEVGEEEKKVKVWVANKETVDDEGGYSTLKDGEDPAKYPLAYGSGIWLVRQEVKKDEAGKIIPFYIYGKPSTAIEVTLDKTMLIGNPLSVPASPVLVEGEDKGAFEQGDQIAVPNDTLAPTRYTWSTAKGDWTRVSSGKIVPGAPVIQPNTGAWFIKKNSTGSATIRWEQKSEENN